MVAASENPDLAVGERIAEVRRQKDLRQDDFLELLAARGVAWTRSTLSRIESGLRALKATELFVVADVLGISADKLNPESGSLPYAIQRQRTRLVEASSRADRSIKAAERARDGLVALLLVHELNSGKTSFVVHGTPAKFVDAVRYAAASEEENSPRATSSGELSRDVQQRWSKVHSLIGLDADEFEKISLRVAEQFVKNGESDNYDGIFEQTYDELFAKCFPDLKFVGNGDGPLYVDGLTGSVFGTVDVDGGG